MKMLFMTFAFVSTLASFAQSELSSLKQKANLKIDQQMNQLKEARNCISSATSLEGYQSCRFELSEQGQIQKMEMKEEKKQVKDVIE